MDDKTLQALTALATKLGTTAEYLWSALLRQAPITGAVDLILTVAMIVAVVLLFRFVAKKTTWRGEQGLLAWMAVAACISLVVIMVLTTLPMTAAALLNPEYWALKQILP